MVSFLDFFVGTLLISAVSASTLNESLISDEKCDAYDTRGNLECPITRFALEWHTNSSVKFDIVAVNLETHAAVPVHVFVSTEHVMTLIYKPATKLSENSSTVYKPVWMVNVVKSSTNYTVHGSNVTVCIEKNQIVLGSLTHDPLFHPHAFTFSPVAAGTIMAVEFVNTNHNAEGIEVKFPKDDVTPSYHYVERNRTIISRLIEIIRNGYYQLPSFALILLSVLVAFFITTSIICLAFFVRFKDDHNSSEEDDKYKVGKDDLESHL